MRIRHEGVNAEMMRYTIYDWPNGPPKKVTEGEVVGVFYNPRHEQPMLLVWDESAGVMLSCPAFEAKKI